MRAIRRVLQVVTLVGTLMVGVLAVALIVSQTPWFRDWLRRYIIRESKQYLNGQMTIGGLGGNLLFGVDLANVAVDVSGEQVIAVKGVELDYNVFYLISKGLVLDRIKFDQPVLRVERDASGWNLQRLVKRQEREADREGPTRPVSLPSIEISDAIVSMEDRTASGVSLPRRVDDLDVKASFEYAPVHYSVVLEHVSFRGSSPELLLQQLSGKIALRDDNLYLDGITLKTSGSSLAMNGVIERYLGTPIVKVRTTGRVSMPEVGRVLPVAAGYNLHPSVSLEANGPAGELALAFDVKSEAGNARGQLTTDMQAPNFAAKGDVEVERLNLAPLLKDPAQTTDLTGHAKLDLAMKSAPAHAAALDRLSGTVAFSGPHVVAAGYELRNVTVTGSMAGPRITIDGRAAAYGGTATARGFIVTPAPGRRLAFDLRGKADHVNLRALPATTGAPQIETNLSAADYHVSGEGQSIQGNAVLNTSTIEGAAVEEGTSAEFALTPGTISYSARGGVSDLDLDRVGTALKIEALAKPAYDSRINGTFEVSGSVPRTPAGQRAPADSASTLSAMKLDATGWFTDSDLLGGRIPELALVAHLDQGTLTGRADGRFEDFNPAQVSGRKELDGRVNGTVNANFAIRDIGALITADAVSADGKATLTRSTIGGLRIDSAEADGRYSAQVGDLTRFTIAGPDVKADASGRLALNRTSNSNVTYHVEAINLTELAKLAGQPDVGGAATLDGTLTGNAASLTTTGSLDGSNLSYGSNSALDLNGQYTVTLPDLDVARVRVEAKTDATFVAVAGMQLNSITATTTYDQRTVKFTTNIKEKTRELDATGEVILHPDHQELHLPVLAVRTQGIEWQTAAGSQATVKYGRDRLELENVRLVSGTQSLDVSGTLALGTATPTGAIEVHARNVDLTQLETLTLQNRGFTGTLNADAKITGSTAAPAIGGKVEIVQGGFQTYRYDSLVANVDYTGTRVGLDATLQQSPTEFITAKGSVPTSVFRTTPGGGHSAPAPADAIDLRVKSSALSLAVIQGLTTQVTNVTGTLEADVHVSGSGQDPHLQGHVDIKNGAFGVPAAGGAFSGLTTRIELLPDVIRIQEFQLLDHHGEKLRVAGDLAVHARQVGALNVSIDSDNFELLDNELGDVQVQAALKVTGELRRPRLVGDLRIDAGRLEVDRVLELFYNPYSVEAFPDVVSADRTVERTGSAEEATREALTRASESAAAPGAAEKAAEADFKALAAAQGGLFEAATMDVHVVLPDNVVLRGKNLRPGGPTGTALGDMNITVGGDLRVRKNPGAPVVLVGTVNTVRGTYAFQGRRFDLVRDGTIRFTGSPTINPNLDITATRKIPDTGVEARIHITGTPKAPELALSSSPPLDESDILALIVFNRPVNELGTGERSSLAATAGGIATGFIAAPLGESIGKALDLDLFEISTTTESGDLGAAITLGQQLNERTFIKLYQQFGDRNTTQFQLEYQLARFLRAQATAAPETSGSANRVNQRRVERAGIDLIFFFSY